MEVRITTKTSLPKDVILEIETVFGFECLLDHHEQDDMDYYVGVDPENLEEGEEEDYFPYDECVKFCGWLRKRGYAGWIVGNGGWVQGMISVLDFRKYGMSESDKNEWARISRIYWREADASKLSEIKPNGDT